VKGVNNNKAAVKTRTTTLLLRVVVGVVVSFTLPLDPDKQHRQQTTDKRSIHFKRGACSGWKANTTPQNPHHLLPGNPPIHPS